MASHRRLSKAEGQRDNHRACIHGTESSRTCVIIHMSTDEYEGHRLQPLSIRITHWIIVPVLVLMAGSGLQIYAAYPALGPRGAQYAWFPLQGKTPPVWLRFGGWLAGARHWHFALAWYLILNGVAYLAYLFVRGEWRRRLFLPHRDLGNALSMFLYYLRI